MRNPEHRRQARDERGGIMAVYAVKTAARPESTAMKVNPRLCRSVGIQFCVAAGMKRVFAAILLIPILATGVHAGTWYLMAADLKIVSNPGVSTRLYQGSRLGPLQLSSQGEFSSRVECEPARDKLIEEWRKQSVVKRGSWDKYGINSPGGFIRCVPDTDPHLTKSPRDRAKEGPSIDVYLRTKIGR
jgi:hypothetical protein